nr:PREDICTED: uncharacterized protein LOC103979247 isoform X1 [Musa acuminata subsp. malaccensis]
MTGWRNCVIVYPLSRCSPPPSHGEITDRGRWNLISPLHSPASSSLLGPRNIISNFPHDFRLLKPNPKSNNLSTSPLRGRSGANSKGTEEKLLRRAREALSGSRRLEGLESEGGGALALTPPCNQHSNQLNPGKEDQLPHGLAAAVTAKPLELGTESSISSSIDGAVCASENFFMFLAAAIAFDLCFKMMVYKSFSY